MCQHSVVLFGMSRSVRFFEILQILRQADAPVTARTLSEKLEVNIRTIYRDIASLQASKLPIEGEAGIGYVMRKGFDLPPLMFSQEELEAITVGLSLLTRSGDIGLIKSAANVSAKISQVLPADNILMTPHQTSNWHQIPQSDVKPEELRRLIRETLEIEITYMDLNETQTQRTIQPIALFYYIDVILLVAWCKLRNGFRHFRIDRIQNLKITGNTFTDQAKRLRHDWESQQKQ